MNTDYAALIATFTVKYVGALFLIGLLIFIIAGWLGWLDEDRKH
jgi:hypothetical protein